MNLNTSYLSLPLHSPLVISASPLSENIDNIKRIEDAGAGAIVLFSLFEEQMRNDRQIRAFLETHPKATLEDAAALYPLKHQFHTDLETYLTHIQKSKESVSIPIIASLNCQSLGAWTEFAQEVQEAGADALELNIYYIPSSMDRTAAQIEDMYVQILRAVKSGIHIPVAVKLSPYLTNLAHLARQLDLAGANGLVLFNRFYQPEFDPVTLKLRSDIPMSCPQESRLPLHWIAILYGYLKADLAATSGIYSAEDVVKMLMVGAKITMLASVLLQEGVDYLRVIERDLCEWLDRNDYASVAELQGIVSQFHSTDPGALERSEYIRAITSFPPPIV